MSSSAVNVNSFSPVSVQAGANLWSDNDDSRVPGNSPVSEQIVDQYLTERGFANPPFNTSTSGRLTPSHDGKITRGFIRRSDPQSGDSKSKAVLNFMYNPETITRDYVSYLDQAALDPFNTVYQSGNLIAPPSFVDFSFQLFFDRQIEEAQGRLPRGVMEDYDFFNIVVRNTAPNNTTSDVPDNGIMMVNPNDITVVFSPELTIQGRPINARVQFQRFSHKMIPTRMTVSLTMRITYFGPLRVAFGLDTFQNIKKYQALVPYSAIYAEEFTEADLRAAREVYEKDQQAAKDRPVNRATPISMGVGGGGVEAALAAGSGVAAIADPASSDVALKTLFTAAVLVKDGPAYVYGGSGPTNWDCSGLVWDAYRRVGVARLLGASQTSRIDTVGIERHARSSNDLQIVCNTKSTNDATLRSLLKPGDIVLKSGAGRAGHIGFFNSWIDNDRWLITHATSPRAGTMSRSIGSLRSNFDLVLRPQIGGSSIGFGGVQV